MIKFILSLLAVSYCFNTFCTESKQSLCSNFEERDYEHAETIFINNTNQLDQQILFIKNRLLPGLSRNESFLDIGPGPGFITQQIAENFKSTAVVEPIKAYTESLSKMGFKVYNSNFQDADVQSSDLVLCSHVLYHVDRSLWKNFLEKICSKINPNGKGVVVLLSPKGEWAEVHNVINPEYSNSAYIKKALDELKVSYEIVPVDSYFRVSNYAEFAELVKLFTIDNSFSSERFKQLSEVEKKSIVNTIEDYISKCKQSDGSYMAKWVDDYFIING